SGVIAAFPLMISLIVFNGRPARSANSICVMPMLSSVSRSVSPGGETTSGWYSFRTGLAMCVCHLQYADGGHLAPVQPTIGLARNRDIRRFTEEPVRMIPVHRKLSVPITCQLMTPEARQVTNVLQHVGSAQFIEPALNQRCPARSIPPHSKFRVVALHLQF